MYSPSSEEAEQRRKVAMAEDLDDGEFWLPPQFLTEKDILMGFDTNSSTGFSSDLGSPVDSVIETESDEDEFVSRLTHQMDRSSLSPNPPYNNNPKGGVLSGSPQSILSPVRSEGSSRRGSPTVPVSPPAFYAAGELPKKGTGYFDSSNRGKQSTPVSPLSTLQNPNLQGFQHPRDKLQPNHFQQLWSQEMMNQRRKTMSPPASMWPAVQRPTNRKPQTAATAQKLSGSGMRAVFLGSKRESIGTGVFLPRSLNQPEPHKKSNSKSGCGTTVLVPEKVVQALKNINAQSQSQTSRLDASNGRFRGDNNGFHGWRQNSENAAAVAWGSLEIRLPSEWTY